MAKKQSIRERTPALEWAAAALGALIVVALIAALMAEALTFNGREVPLLKAEATRIVPAGTGHIVQVRVTNTSPQTAAAVQIEGEVAAPGGEPETSTATLDYVPGRSHSEVGLIFTKDPRGRLKLRVVGYEVP